MNANPTAATPSERLLSLDALRGLTMLMLLPDVFGGFSFHKMARQFPDDPLWTTLARTFTHAQWSGCTLWDLVMPLFVFMVGVSMPYSHAARRARGDSPALLHRRALQRALVLMILGLLLQMPVHTLYDLAAPLLLLTTGLPMESLLQRWAPAALAARSRRLEQLWRISILLLVGGLLMYNFELIGSPALHDVLPQIALGYFAAYLLIGRGRAIQLAVLGFILLGYWLAFSLYPLPPEGTNLAALGVAPTDQVYTGFFAHWNKNTNLAAGFDLWFLNLLPRSEPFLFNEHGYQSLNFIPTIGTMLLGLMTGEYLRGGRTRKESCRGLWRGGLALLIAGMIAGAWICPVVKSIWTPSWVLFSGGCTLLALAGFYQIIDLHQRQIWATPLIIAGRNPILLYTLACVYRWWILKAWHLVAGPGLFRLATAPVIESVLVALTLWAVAVVLDRLRIYIRI